MKRQPYTRRMRWLRQTGLLLCLFWPGLAALVPSSQASPGPPPFDRPRAAELPYQEIIYYPPAAYFLPLGQPLP